MTTHACNPTRPDARASFRARLVAIAVMTVAAVVMTACGDSSTDDAAVTADTAGAGANLEADAGEPVPGGALSYGVAAETDDFNPYVGQWSTSSYTVANAMFEPLAAIAEDGQIKPYLAESISSSPDFMEWTITLRPDVRFHDGSPLDAAAVVTNLEAGRSSALTSGALAPIDTITAVDDLTVEVDMKTPWSTYPQMLAVQTGYMAAPAMLAEPGADPIGTGPFAFESHVPDVSLEVTRNDDYWQAGMPYLDEITFKIIIDSVTRVAAFDSGDIDAAEVLDPDTLAKYLPASDEGELQLLTNEGQETDEQVIALNTSVEPFNDPVARQALAAAIDQEQISQVSYGGLYPAAWGNFDEGSPYYISREEAGYPAHDVARARELAQQYEQTHGTPISFTYIVPGDPRQLVNGQALQAQLSEAGIKMDLRQIEQTVLITSVVTGDYQAAVFAMWSAPTLDKGYFFIATEPTDSGISLNYTRLNDPEITAAMDEARATSDQAAQIEAYKKVQKRMAINLDKIFVVHPRTAVAFSTRVHGFTKATFPGTDQRAFAPEMINPFLTTLWVES